MAALAIVSVTIAGGGPRAARAAANPLPVETSGPSVTLSSLQASAGDSIRITYTGAQTAKSWLGLYRAKEPAENYISWVYAGSCAQVSAMRESGSCDFSLPDVLQDGEYEIRMNRDNSYSEIARSTVFQVGAVETSTSSVTSSSLPGGYQAKIYISPDGNDGNSGSEQAPLRSFIRARDVVRSINGKMSGNIAVVARAGFYPLDDPLVLDERDGGTNGYFVEYTSYPGEKAILTSAQRVTDWVAIGGGKYRARLTGQRTDDVRVLYIDGQRMHIARNENDWPQNSNYLSAESSFDIPHYRLFIPASQVQGWEGTLASGKARIQLHFPWWTSVFRVAGVESVSGGLATIRLANVDMWLHDRLRDAIFYFEGSADFVDKEGEFAFDPASQEIILMPPGNVNLSTASVIVAASQSGYGPAGSTLISIAGAGSPARNIAVRNLSFQYNAINGNSSFFGSGWYTNESLDYPMPAALEVTNATKIIVERNEFRRLGASGLLFRNSVSDSTILGNYFNDVAGNGISVGDLKTPIPGLDVRNLVISNNLVTDCGVEYLTSTGMTLGILDGGEILHNEIRDIGYSGITLYQSPTANRPSIVKNNKITRTNTKIHDGGGFYTYGPQPGLYIFENEITSTGICFYLDDGVDGVTVENNVSGNCGLDHYYKGSNNVLINGMGNIYTEPGSTTILTRDGFDPQSVSARAASNGTSGLSISD